MRASEFLAEATKAVKQRLDPKCWTGKHKEGTKIKGGIRVNNCVPNESVEESKQRCKQCGMTNCSCKPGTCKCKPIAGWIPNKGFKKAVDETIAAGSVPAGDPILNDPNLYLLLEHYLGKSFIQWAAEMSPYTPRNSTFDTIKVNAIKPLYHRVASRVKPLAAGPEPDIDSIIRIVFTIPGLVSSNDQQRILDKIKQQQTADEEEGWVWKGTSTQTAQTGTTNEDWNKVNHKDKTDGLSQKAVNAYRRENPGSKLKTAVTTKPSKLKAGSKDAKRRKSFCARMSGNKGPMKKPNGKPTPKALALRRWNCESVEEMVDMIIENMDHAKDNQAVPELKAALLAKKTTLQNASEDGVYDIIDKMMTRIAKSHGISGQKLHDMWVDQYDQIPDTWIMK